MGVVYISREAGTDRFTVGAAQSFSQRRRGGYTRYNPRLRTSRVLRTTDHFALESFLHNELAAKRDRDITSESWYNLTAEEMDIAIERAETLGREHLQRKRKVDEIKNSATDGTWREPTDRLKEIHGRLAQLVREKDALCHEEAILKLEAMAEIGTADGVEGLFEWPSYKQRKFQTKIFAMQYPDLYDQFRSQVFVRRFSLWKREEEDCENLDY